MEMKRAKRSEDQKQRDKEEGNVGGTERETESIQQAEYGKEEDCWDETVYGREN